MRFILKTASVLALILCLAGFASGGETARDLDNGVWTTLQETITGSEMIAFVRDYVETSPPWSDYGVTAEILRLPPDLTLREGERRVIVRRLRQGDFTTANNLRLEVQLDGVIYKSFGVSQYLQLTAPLAVATHPLKRDDLITEADLKLERIPLDDVKRGEPFCSIEELQGKKVLTSIQAGTPVSSAQVDLPYAVRRNDIVAIVYKSGPLTVRCKGKALEHGRVGQTVRVLNKQTEKIVEALVTDQGVVSLSF